MSFIQDLPIKQKLALIVTLTSFTGLLVSALILYAYDKKMHRQEMREELAVLGEVISDRSTAALVFSDPDLARENLASLSASSSIVAACIYSESSTIFATYTRGQSDETPAGGRSCPSEPSGGGHRFGENSLHLFQDIVLDGAQIGTIYIRADLREINAHMTQNLLIVISVMFVASLVAFLFSLKLQGLISSPIRHLADRANLVATRKDYSVRAVKTGRDELGLLTDRFNAMLEQIERQQTDRDKSEEELRLHRNHLEGLVRVRTEELYLKNKELGQSQEALTSLLEDVNESRVELDEANRQLKELDDLKTMFIASMSHELRTPLNAIIGFTGIILQGMSGEINADQRAQLKRVYVSAKHLLGLISEIIDISKVEAGKLEPYLQTFSLYGVIKEAISNLKNQIKEKGLGIETDIPPYIQLKSDRTRLLQCLLNYLSNAVKFTDRGKIFIMAKEVNNMIEIRVKDTGVGIQDVDIPKLFSPYSRIDTGQRPRPLGTGLGLYLTQKLTDEVLRGSVALESEYGKGSTFILKVPVNI